MTRGPDPCRGTSAASGNAGPRVGDSQQRNSVQNLQSIVYTTGLCYRVDSDPPSDSIFEQEDWCSNPVPLRFGALYWQCTEVLAVFATLYSVAYIPLKFAFEVQAHYVVSSRTSEVLEHLATVVVGGAALLRFVTSYCDERHGREVMAAKDVREAVLCSASFWADVISCLGSVIPAFGGSPFFGLFFGFRCYRLVHDPRSFLIAWKHSTILRLTRAIVVMVLMGHLCACAWFALVNGGQTEDAHWFAVTSPTTRVDSGRKSFFVCYLCAFRDAVYILQARTQVANQLAEVGFLAGAGMLGWTLTAWFVGYCVLLIRCIMFMKDRDRENIAHIKAALQTSNLPSELQRRVLDFHHFLSLHHNPMVTASLFRHLSLPLKTELRLYMYRNVLREVPFFQNASPRALNAIIMALVDAVFSPGDLVIRRGDRSRNMYVVLKGRCDVLDEKMLVIKTLVEQGYFGETALVAEMARSATVRASTYSVLLCLSAKSFHKIVREFPEQGELMQQRLNLGLDAEQSLRATQPSTSSSGSEESGDSAADVPGSPSSHGEASSPKLSRGTTRSRSSKTSGSVRPLVGRLRPGPVQSSTTAFDEGHRAPARIAPRHATVVGSGIHARPGSEDHLMSSSAAKRLRELIQGAETKVDRILGPSSK